jgi:O-antigen/teichoic acid export membrane protein
VNTTAATATQPRLSVQAFWLTISKFISALFNIAIPILLVRLLDQNQYGVYKQAFLFAGTLTSLASFGVGLSAFYFMPRHPERGGKIALNILIYNTVAGLIPLVVLIVYPKALNWMFRSGDLQSYAVLLGILSMVSLTGVLVETMPTALQDVRNSTIFVVGTQLMKAVLILAAALLVGTVRSLVWATIVSGFICVVVLVRYLHQRFGPFWMHFDGHFFREQLAYALPLGVYGMIYVIRRDLSSYFVSAFYPPSEFAIYAIGWLEVPLISLFLESVLAVMVVRVSALQHEDRVQDIRRVMATAINRLAAVQFPIYALLLVAGKDLIVFFYTRTYEASAHIFAITITLILLNVFLYDPVVRAYKHLRNFIIIVRVAVLVAQCALLAPVIRHFGMTGAALTAVAADVVERVIVSAKVCSTIEVSWADLGLIADLWRVAAVTTAAGLAAYAVRTLMVNQPLVVRIAAMGIAFAIVYLAGFYAWKLPGWETVSKDNLLDIYRRRVARLRGASA